MASGAGTTPVAAPALKDVFALPEGISEGAVAGLALIEAPRPRRRIVLQWPRVGSGGGSSGAETLTLGDGDAKAGEGGEMNSGSSSGKRDAKDAHLTPTVMSVIIGNCLAAKGKASSSGSFELILPKNFGGKGDGVDDNGMETGEQRDSRYFGSSKKEGNCEPGASTTVTFMFKPPTNQASSDSGELQVGQWLETVIPCRLKGGFAPSNRTSEEIVDIVLRAFAVL